ncbi:hypothetical protein Tco_0524746 [Tanacetum coccineum]
MVELSRSYTFFSTLSTDAHARQQDVERIEHSGCQCSEGSRKGPPKITRRLCQCSLPTSSKHLSEDTEKNVLLITPLPPPSPGFLVYSALAFSVDHSKSKYTIYVIRSMQAYEDFFLWNVSIHIYNSIEKTRYNLDDTEASVGVLRDESVIPEPCALTCGRLMEDQRKLVLVGGMGRPDRPGVIKGIGIWVLDGKEWTEIIRMPHKYAHGFGELDDVFASSGGGDLIYIQGYGGTSLLEFGTIGEILGLSKENGEDIKECYIKYLDVFTSYYKTARVPQQEYKAILKKSTKKVEEDKDRDCLMSHQWDFGETCAPTANIAVQKGKEKLEHFGVKLEDTEDGEDNQPQPISSHYTRNQNLQGKIIGPSTSRKSDIGDSGSNTSDDFTIIT